MAKPSFRSLRSRPEPGAGRAREYQRTKAGLVQTQSADVLHAGVRRPKSPGDLARGSIAGW